MGAQPCSVLISRITARYSLFSSVSRCGRWSLYCDMPYAVSKFKIQIQNSNSKALPPNENTVDIVMRAVQVSHYPILPSGLPSPHTPLWATVSDLSSPLFQLYDRKAPQIGSRNGLRLPLPHVRTKAPTSHFSPPLFLEILPKNSFHVDISTTRLARSALLIPPPQRRPATQPYLDSPVWSIRSRSGPNSSCCSRGMW